MKQTFEIEHTFDFRLNDEDISQALGSEFDDSFIKSVTEITEPEKCEFECCEKRSINECPYCGKPIEVRDGK